MAATFHVIALSSRDPDGRDTLDEPKLLYPDALETARQLKDQGKAFRVVAYGEHSADQMQAFGDLGALE
ncbi:hypothetical protein [Pararhizobium qamdonense]|uniref:hypothetical protein n=1 Tax=Pararhizobium qamdonense TaxID=3031126 RepID=UPI0023E1E23A|nr:hypothetical protein [Pararhizobium qamdonense]